MDATVSYSCNDSFLLEVVAEQKLDGWTLSLLKDLLFIHSFFQHGLFY